ncbi:mechanosensitive ion channel [Persicimonas caeni]|uniref:Mechanosensitive ion channel n=1 Tax=Persicimonas caeni TaxID=2292766 RepID=A0A4Y6PR46_PERCE|nr:mechanosensitive ion channel domain-containing protein [Persicimonas caeni]QDG50720.1 mechanosensitive ion channel [Persicimonas caeni]QED31941.1 mechanosensitive ion channel [Persicimonas caeni]
MDPQQTQAASQVASQVAGEAVPLFLQPVWALSIFLGAVLISLGIGYLARLPGLRRVRHWLLLTRVLVWTVAVFNTVFALFRPVTEHWVWLGVLVLGLMALAGIDWLRNVAAGLAVAFESHFHVGDMVRFGNVEGEVVNLGTRAVTMRAPDGTLHQIPNESLTRDAVTHLEADGEAACEIVVALPKGVSPERALKLAQQAAFLTPLASPHHRPDVFLDVDRNAGGGIQLHIRGFAFDPGHREHFRSDVVARIHDMLRIESAPS